MTIVSLDQSDFRLMLSNHRCRVLFSSRFSSLRALFIQVEQNRPRFEISVPQIQVLIKTFPLRIEAGVTSLPEIGAFRHCWLATVNMHELLGIMY